MQNNPLHVNLMQHLAAVRLCLDNHLRNPALMLIYGGIDVVASLNPQKKEQADRHDFVFWSERYMDCVTRLGVTGLDLYAARCGILHTYTFNSNLSRRRMARRIIYAWGNRTIDEPNALMHELGFSERMVKIEELFLAFAVGIDTFCAMLDQNPGLATSVYAKARQFFVEQPRFP